MGRLDDLDISLDGLDDLDVSMELSGIAHSGVWDAPEGTSEILQDSPITNFESPESLRRRLLRA